MADTDTRTPDTRRSGPADLSDTAPYSPSGEGGRSPDSSSIERTRTPDSSVGASTPAFPRHPTAFGKTPDDGSGCATAFCGGDH